MSGNCRLWLRRGVLTPKVANSKKKLHLQVIEHVYEKVMNGGSEAGSGAGTPTGERGHGGADGEEGSSMAEAQVALPEYRILVWEFI